MAVMSAQAGLQHSQWLRVYLSRVSVPQLEGAALFVW